MLIFFLNINCFVIRESLSRVLFRDINFCVGDGDLGIYSYLYVIEVI